LSAEGAAHEDVPALRASDIFDDFPTTPSRAWLFHVGPAGLSEQRPPRGISNFNFLPTTSSPQLSTEKCGHDFSRSELAPQLQFPKREEVDSLKSPL